MTQFDDFKELITKFENKKVQYNVIAGYAFDGLRGAITRSHEDIDINVLEKDSEKVFNIIETELNYNLLYMINDLNKYQRGLTEIDLIFAKEKDNNLVQKVRMVELSFPNELFFEAQKVSIDGFEFNIPRNEFLRYNIKPENMEDKKLAESLGIDESLFNRIQHKKI